MNQEFHSATIDQFLAELNLSYTDPEDEIPVGYLHNTQKLLYEFKKEVDEPFNAIHTCPVYFFYDEDLRLMKELYLPEVLKLNTKKLILESCNFFTFYQYFP